MALSLSTDEVDTASDALYSWLSCFGVSKSRRKFEVDAVAVIWKNERKQARSRGIVCMMIEDDRKGTSTAQR